MNIEEIAQNISESNLLETLLHFFKGDSLELLAKESKFIKRSSSRLNGKMFLELNINDFGRLGG